MKIFSKIDCLPAIATRHITAFFSLTNIYCGITSSQKANYSFKPITMIELFQSTARLTSIKNILLSSALATLVA